jgi:hypothetical protein
MRMFPRNVGCSIAENAGKITTLNIFKNMNIEVKLDLSKSMKDQEEVLKSI